MNGEKLSNRIAAFMSTLMFLILAAMVFIRAMSFDINTLIHALKISLTGAFVSGVLGYFIGTVLEKQSAKPKKKTLTYENEGLIDDLLVDDMQQLDKEIH